MGDVLILNASFEPLSMVPLSIITWQRAIRLVFLERVNVLEYYDDWKIHSPSITLNVPSVIVTKEYFNFDKRINFSKQNLFLRDLYQCQYCGTTFSLNDLTVDHVIPRSKGGTTKWENTVSACEPCNTKKAHHDKMSPMVKPYDPNYWDLAKNMRHKPIKIRHLSWARYLANFNIQNLKELEMAG